MLSNETGKTLHDKATRGKPLTLEEQNLLEQWYNEQDNAESQWLKSNDSIKDQNILQKQIDTILIQIKSATDNIQRLTAENKLLKNDITKLHNQLSEKMMEQAI